MQHHRAMVCAVFTDVLQVEPLWQAVIQLNGPELPAALQGIRDVELELRAVERAFARELLERDVARHQGAAQRAFCAVPKFVRADALLWAECELYRHVLEVERGVHLEQEAIEVQNLLLDLVFRAEDVRVVLAKAADARQAVHHACALVTMQAPEVRHAPRQLTVTAPAMPED